MSTPIHDHGVIGNMKSVALVSLHASVDFLCYPAFDSPTVFASLLDREHGGRFEMRPDLENVHVKQMYLPETNVLLTRFLTEDACGEVIDFMPVTSSAEDDSNRLVRLVRTVRGQVHWRAECSPRFDYARRAHHARTGPHGSILFTPAPGDTALEAMQLAATVEWQNDGRDAWSEFTLERGQSAAFVFGGERSVDDDTPPLADDCDFCLAQTIDYWRAWSARSNYRGRYREIVSRSALALKLLCCAKTGAIIAAPTFGLAETLEGHRKWDYRYAWIRDAAFAIYALLRLGHTEEAGAFIHWIGERADRCGYDGSLSLVYTIAGELPPDETSVDTLADGRGQDAPKIGNAAAHQFQLDVYGALLDAIYLHNKYGTGISYKGWNNVVKTVDFVVDHWHEPDHGIWELRSGKRALLHSRLMCWVAVDRALRLAAKRSLPAPFERWTQARNEIHHSVFTDFWNAERGAFMQSQGSDQLDAAALLMPLVKFISPSDPQWLSTLDAIGRELLQDPLVYRYLGNHDGTSADGLDGVEGAFSACSFWYAEALARAGKVQQARLLFEKMLGHANHLGLFAEEMSAGGQALGNFPQGLTHLALISAAYRLDRDLGRQKSPWSE